MTTRRWVAFAAALVVLVGLVTGAGPRTARSSASPPPSPAPNGLVTGLQALDRRIALTIDRVEKNELKGSELEKAAGALRDNLYKLLVDYFPPVFGLPFYKVFNGFLGIDSYLTNARSWLSIGNDDKSAASIDHANGELKGLQDELTGKGASGVPPALLEGLKHLREGLTAAARRARSRSLKSSELGGLYAEKLKLIDDNTKGVLLFGQPFGEVYRKLDSLTFDFEATEFGIPFGTTTTKHHALVFLKAAKASKEGVQDQLIQPVVSISATFYPKGAAGACDDTQFHPNFGETCYAVSKTAPNAKTSWSPGLVGFNPPVQDPNCNRFNFFYYADVWHHGDEDGCSHFVEGPNGHMGTFNVTVADKYWNCAAVYLGTNDPDTTTKTGPAGVCFPAGQVVLTVVNMGVGPAGNSRNAPFGNGTVTSSPAGINCDTSCQVASVGFPKNAQVTLTATPDSSSTFAGWSGGGCSGTGSCTVTMNIEKTVLATFQHM